MAVFDSTFVRRLRQRDPGAFETLVGALLPRVRRIAMQYFQSPFEQEDAVQEAFVHVFQGLDAIDPTRADTLEGFVLTTARRRMLDLLRRGGPAPGPIDDVPEEALAQAPSAPGVVADAELKALLERFEEKLKPAWRPAYRAVFVEGKEWEDARAALGLSALRARYLKAVLHRALRRHQPLLEHLERRRTS